MIKRYDFEMCRSWTCDAHPYIDGNGDYVLFTDRLAKIKELEDKNKQLQGVVEAADDFKDCCAITKERIDMLIAGHKFSVDELDEIDLEESLAKSRLLKALESLQGETK